MKTTQLFGLYGTAGLEALFRSLKYEYLGSTGPNELSVENRRSLFLYEQ